MPPGVIATVWAAIVTAVTRAASPGSTVDARPSRRSATPARSRAARRAWRRGRPAPSQPRRGVPGAAHARAPASRGDRPAAGRETTASGIPAPPTRRSASAGPSRAAIATTASTSAARSSTVDAVAAATGSRVRRTTLDHPQRLAQAQRQQVVARPARRAGPRATARSDSPGSARHQARRAARTPRRTRRGPRSGRADRGPRPRPSGPASPGQPSGRRRRRHPPGPGRPPPSAPASPDPRSFGRWTLYFNGG